jgi:hypothetical protein
MTAKYDKVTNPAQTFKYEIIRMSDDKNTHEILETYDKLEEALDKQIQYGEKNIRINLRALHDRL